MRSGWLFPTREQVVGPQPAFGNPAPRVDDLTSNLLPTASSPVLCARLDAGCAVEVARRYAGMARDQTWKVLQVPLHWGAATVELTRRIRSVRDDGWEDRSR